MNLKINSVICLVIFFSFLGNFGINLLGQNIYFYYIVEIILLSIIFFSNKYKINISSIEIKLISLFFLLIFLSAFINLFSSVPDFKGQSFYISSLKGMIYISLNFLMILLIVSYGVNEKFFRDLKKTLKLIILFYLIYFILEFYQDYYSKNEVIRFILNIFHIRSRSIDKDFINLLGSEHSNSSIFVLILYAFMTANLLNGKKVFNYNFIDMFILSFLILAIFLMESKLGYLIFGILNIVILIQVLFNKKKTYKFLIALTIFILLILVFNQFFQSKIEKALGLILNYEHPSFNLRANFALASIYMIFQNPFFGVGLNNFKFYVEEAINALKSLQWIDIKVDGDYLEINSYLYNDRSIPDPGNLILGIGAEVGLIGLLFFLFILTKIFFKSFFLTKKKNLNKDDKTLAEFFFYSLIIVYISFVGFYQLYFIIQWLIIGLNICFYIFIKKKYLNN